MFAGAPLPEEPETNRDGGASAPNHGEGGTNVFAAAAQEPSGANRMTLVAGGIGVALLLSLVFYLVTRPKAEPGAPQQPVAAQAPANPATAQPAAPAAPANPAVGKPVKFRVITEPPAAQVFFGARMMGETPVEFEAPSDKPDGTVTIDLVLILDGYFPLPVTAGGSGVVIITQRMQKRAGVPQAGLMRPAPGTLFPPRKGGKRGPAEDPAYEGKLDAPELMVEAPLIAAPPPKTPEPAPAKTPEPAPPVAAATPAPPPPPPVAAAAPAPGGVMPFNSETMNRPQVVEKGKPLQYTPEALHARVEGSMIVKCVISTAGRVENCRFIKTLPYMEKAVLEALTSRTYKPIMQDGRVVPVDYLFEVKLKLPTEL
jgi:serine/threonine-protein kinase